MANFEKDNSSKNYSTKHTLEHLKEVWLPYSFIIEKNVQPLAVKDGVIEVWDTLTITKIELKSETEWRTHSIEYTITNDFGKNVELNMSWWVFLENFRKNMLPEDIVEKKLNKETDWVKTSVDELIR